MATKAGERFHDVSADAYYAAAVGWMVEHKITAGCEEANFCPGNPVSRQQSITFLWRAAGSPRPDRPGSEIFNDVNAASYADAAIGWAAEAGVTSGCRQATDSAPADFCPRQPISRAQLSTFLYRYVGADHRSDAQVFEDVDPDATYANPVAWMAAHRITTGCSGSSFCPQQTATRAHVPVFLYRVASKPDAWGGNDVIWLQFLED